MSPWAAGVRRSSRLCSKVAFKPEVTTRSAAEGEVVWGKGRPQRGWGQRLGEDLVVMETGMAQPR